MQELPKQVVFVDVETTGLSSDDRIVSLGAVALRTESVREGNLDFRTLHLICNPGRPNHPRAVDVHGYDDWILRHQERFEDNASTISAFVNDGELIVAHNATSNLGFLNREFAGAGQQPIRVGSFCTMQHHRSLGRGSASLESLCQQIGIVRDSGSRGALEDAWLAMVIYLWQHDIPLRAKYPPGDLRTPSNLKPTPPPVRPWNVRERPIDAIFDRLEPPLRSVPGIGLRGPADDIDPELSWEEQADLDGVAVGIVYRDMSGQLSERTIRCEAIRIDDGNIYIEAWCLLRGERRTFHLDRIEAVFDYHTGEFLGDALGFFADHVPSSWPNTSVANRRKGRRDIVKEFADGAKILMFLAMGDGELHKAEHQLILDYAMGRLHRAGYRDSDSEARASEWVRNYIPSRRAAKLALLRIVMNEEHGAEIARRIVDVIVADGRTTNEEMKAVRHLVETMENHEQRRERPY